LSKKRGGVPTSRMNKVKSFKNRCMKIKHCSWKLYYYKRFFRPIDEAQNDFTVFFLWQRWKGRAVILHERMISLHFFFLKKKKQNHVCMKNDNCLYFFNTKKKLHLRKKKKNVAMKDAWFFFFLIHYNAFLLL
jgi:hypothetical protein